jgi:hypothetical protein
VPLITATRTSRNGCTVHLFQRICCFLIMRWATISFIALSTKAVELGGSFAGLPASPETWHVGDERNNGWSMNQDLGGAFKGRHFTAEVILWALRWYLAFPVSYRDLALMLSDRGVAVDHTTIFRWVRTYAAMLEKRLRPHLRPNTGSWRVDETYIKVKGAWTYLSGCGQPGPDDRLPALTAWGRCLG